jgi:SAM-dependent methyltransferase
VGNGKQLPFPESCFDLINLDSLMHHLVDRGGYSATILNLIEFLQSLKSVLRPQGKLIISEIYHESFIRDDMASRLLFIASTSTLPRLLALPIRSLIRTQGVGICFLSRKQWFWVIARSGYRIEGWKELRWDIPFLRRLAGFKASGDLVFLLSPI